MAWQSDERWRARWLAVLALVVLAACGKQSAQNPPHSTSSPSPSPSVSTPSSKEFLFAVLESHTKSPDGFGLYETVAIAGLDGFARAKTTFAPLTPPYVGCVGPLFPPQAHTASGRVFFIDGKGVVRSLGPDRTVKEVASFPIGKQQEA